MSDQAIDQATAAAGAPSAAAGKLNSLRPAAQGATARPATTGVAPLQPAAAMLAQPEPLLEAGAAQGARRRAHILSLLGLAPLAAGFAALLIWRDDVWLLITDEQAIEALIERAGYWGPLTLIAITILQIVIAPVPGYVVQLAAGFLFGTLWGGLYGAVGILIGSMLSMFLARTLGRPLAIWMLGPERLQRWESVTHSESPWVWLMLMVTPLGDSVYLLAGLSRVSYLTILLLTLAVRIPTSFLSSAIGGGHVPFFWLVALAIVACAAALVGYRYREALSSWFDHTLKQRLATQQPALAPAVSEAVDEPPAEAPSAR